jgi:diaminopimelate decarboxylase
MTPDRPIPFTLAQIRALSNTYPTPFYVYDEAGIRREIRRLLQTFSWNKGFREYFPIKALPNPAIVRILRDEGCGADCISVPELMIADRLGMSGDSVTLTSNQTADEEFAMARRMNAIINLDDADHLSYVDKRWGLPEVLCARYNPGPTEVIGTTTWPRLENQKFGMRKDQLFETYIKALNRGVRRFGLHMMIMSNDIDGLHIVDTARKCFETAVELRRLVGIDLEFIDLGGGVGIPYRPDQVAIDMVDISRQIRELYEQLIAAKELAPFRLYTEFGRYVTGQHGYLVTKVRHVKHSYKRFVGLDASMADFMRPGMYGSYHHIELLDGQGTRPITTYDVVGSLGANNDKFAIDRELPTLQSGDVLVIHDVGAYGRGKGFNFNGKLRAAELLLRDDGTFQQIRRAETPDDYFITLCDWESARQDRPGRPRTDAASAGEEAATRDRAAGVNNHEERMHGTARALSG